MVFSELTILLQISFLIFWTRTERMTIRHMFPTNLHHEDDDVACLPSQLPTTPCRELQTPRLVLTTALRWCLWLIMITIQNTMKIICITPIQILIQDRSEILKKGTHSWIPIPRCLPSSLIRLECTCSGQANFQIIKWYALLLSSICFGYNCGQIVQKPLIDCDWLIRSKLVPNICQHSVKYCNINLGDLATRKRTETSNKIKFRCQKNRNEYLVKYMSYSRAICRGLAPLITHHIYNVSKFPST